MPVRSGASIGSFVSSTFRVSSILSFNISKIFFFFGLGPGNKNNKKMRNNPGYRVQRAGWLGGWFGVKP